jgi:hypothetical protein
MYNNSQHSVIGKTLMELLMGFQGDLWVNILKELESKNVNTETRIKELEDIHVLLGK